MNIKLKSIAAVLFVITLSCLCTVSRAQDAHEDLTPCPGSAPEPSQSSGWPIAFCNRTGHDVVVEFHDNDCPAKDWARRGDVYQRTLKHGESKTFPLCYANEQPAKKPAPGVPTLRIAGGKGVTTTWNVVGDCGDRSKPLNQDARTFYDRGDYKTGIILLQYPSGASHCTSDASVGAATTPPTASSQALTGSATAAVAASASEVAPKAPQLAAQPPVATHSPIAPTPAAATAAPPPPAAPPAAAAPAASDVPRGSGPPTLTAVIDPKTIVHHVVQVFAKGGAGYKCNFNLALTFTDGGTWNDRAKVNITGSEDVPIVTRKYLKSVFDVKITSNSCSAM